MIVRLATLNDIDGIMRLIAEVVPVMRESGNFQWDDTYPNAEVFRDDIAQGHLWVADVDSDIAGVVAITKDQWPEYGQVGWDLNEPAIVPHRVAVSTRYRGMGIGAALLVKSEEVAAAQGIKLLRMDTNSNNKATRQLFPKMGYEFSGEIKLTLRPNQRFYCYEKRLG